MVQGNFYGSCHGNWFAGTFGPAPAAGPHSEKLLFAPRLRRGDQAKKQFLRPAHQNCHATHKNFHTQLLAVDIGNTTVSIGIFKGRLLVHTRKVLTKKPVSNKYYLAEFKKILKNRKVGDIIVSSVVPDTTKALKRIFMNSFGIRPIVLGEDLTVPIKNLYKNPKQVGQDRLVNAYAAYKKYGGGLIIVDFGTAVTFDVVSRKGEYMGGIIVPGIEIALEALLKRAALLAKIKLSVGAGLVPARIHKGRPQGPPLLGHDTKTSVLSGVLHGYGALCDGLIAKIKSQAGRDYKVILTGGHAALISRYCGSDRVEPNLTLEGLYELQALFSSRHFCPLKIRGITLPVL